MKALCFSNMAEARSVENDGDKQTQNIELTDKDHAQNPTDEKSSTSSTPKETKSKSTFKLG